VWDLNHQVDAVVEKECHCTLEVVGSTNGSGDIRVKTSPNPWLTQATKIHEESHKQDNLAAFKQFGKGSKAWVDWYTNPRRFAAGEVKAYSADIKYLEDVVRANTPPQ